MTLTENTVVSPDTSINTVMEKIAENAQKVALVVDDNRELLGVVTDGDIRRGILDGIPLESNVSDVMNQDPIISRPEDDEQSILQVMKGQNIHQMPIVDENGVLRDLVTIDELIQPDPIDNWVVFMAGGLGTRLRPLTEDRPKPLVEVGDRPILEKIMLNFIDQGFHRFLMTVNYKSDMIREHFGDGSEWGVEIRYYEEEEKLGTAGALGVLPIEPEEPVIVTNSDLLTEVDFGNMLQFHEEQGAAATMGVREYEFRIPYGVIRNDNHLIESIEEKPAETRYINAGMYVLDPSVLSMIPEHEEFEMTEVFEKVISRGMDCVVYPVTEYWKDIGRKEDLQEVRNEAPEDLLDV